MNSAIGLKEVSESATSNMNRAPPSKSSLDPTILWMLLLLLLFASAAVAERADKGKRRRGLEGCGE